MSNFIVVIAMIGSWFLFAGPIYQAYLELHDSNMQASEVRRVFKEYYSEGEIPTFPKWFWLFPPLGLFFYFRMRKKVRMIVFYKLDMEHFEVANSYLSKAYGWIIISFGALLVASKETFEFSEHYEFSTWIFCLLNLFLMIISIFCIVLIIKLNNEMKKDFMEYIGRTDRI